MTGGLASRPQCRDRRRHRGGASPSPVLTRLDFYDGVKPIAANIDQIVIVSAVMPEFSTNIVDRYLVAAEDGKSPPSVLNKVDMLDEAARIRVEGQLAATASLGYPVILVAARAARADAAQGRPDRQDPSSSASPGRQVVTTNALMPGLGVLTGEISETRGWGTHTTTTARALSLPSGGDPTRLPWIRESPSGIWADRITWCFVEFRDYLGSCKFRDCTHKDDPG